MRNFDTETRWENYRKANSEKPSARENELKKVFELVNPQPAQTILEVGIGNGYLTFPIAEAVGINGKVITADIVEKNIYDVVKRNTQGLSIIPYLLQEESALPKGLEIYFISVATIATLHHFDNRSKQSGDTGDFVHTIHNAQVSPEESFIKAKEILGFKQIGNHFELGWELFFLTATKS